MYVSFSPTHPHLFLLSCVDFIPTPLPPSKYSCWLDQTHILPTLQYLTSSSISFLIAVAKVAGRAFISFYCVICTSLNHSGEPGISWTTQGSQGSPEPWLVSLDHTPALRVCVWVRVVDVKVNPIQTTWTENGDSGYPKRKSRCCIGTNNIYLLLLCMYIFMCLCICIHICMYNFVCIYFYFVIFSTANKFTWLKIQKV